MLLPPQMRACLSPPALCATSPAVGRKSLSRTRAIESAQVGESFGDSFGQRVGMLATQVDDLLRDAHLEEPSTKIDELAAVYAIPTKLEGAPDLGWIAAHGSAGLIEHRRELLDPVGVAAGDVPDIGVTRDQAQSCLARSTNPDRRVRPLDRLRIGDRVLQAVVPTFEVGPLLGPQRLDDMQRFAQQADAVVESFDAVHAVLDLRP